MADRPLRSRRSAVFVGGAFILLALLLLTGAAEWAWSTSIDRDEEAPIRAQSQAVDEVQRALQGVLQTMESRAERVATHQDVIRALMQDSIVVSADAIVALKAFETGPRDAIEIYAPDGHRVAWSGFAFPARRLPIPDSLVTRTVRDPAGRRSLALWYPIEAERREAQENVTEGQTIGAIRIVRLAQASVPVRNQYLQDYDLSDAWRSEVSRPFAVQFIPRSTPPSPTAVPLTGLDGVLLGWAEVPRPSVRALQASVRTITRGLAAVWGVLLIAWLLAGLGMGWWEALCRAEREDRRPAWIRAGLWLAALVAAGVASRYALLAADVPVRWLDATNRPAPLFDPTYLASDLGETRSKALDELKQVAEKNGFDLRDLVGGSSGRSKKTSSRRTGKVAPKYRHPDEPDVTWSGRGRQPKWVAEYERKNGSLDGITI